MSAAVSIVPGLRAMTPDQAVARHMNVVHNLARRFLRAGVDHGDLIQEGTLGLMKAAQLWREDGGASFSTFAYWHVSKRMRLVARHEHRHGISGSDVTALDVRSMDAPIGEDDGGSLHDVIGESEEEPLVEADALARLRGAIESLDEDERRIIEGRLAEKTSEEIGATLGRSRENARQREQRAVDRLRVALGLAAELRHRGKRGVEYQGVTKSIAEWAREFGVNYVTLYHRLLRGWSMERALAG